MREREKMSGKSTRGLVGEAASRLALDLCSFFLPWLRKPDKMKQLDRKTINAHGLVNQSTLELPTLTCTPISRRAATAESLSAGTDSSVGFASPDIPTGFPRLPLLSLSLLLATVGGRKILGNFLVRCTAVF